MNPIYYDNYNKCTVVQSMYYPDPKETKPKVVEAVKEEKIVENVIEKQPIKTNPMGGKKEVQFSEENILETKTPIFSNYFLDRDESDPNFFKKKIQSYYHENIPEHDMENIFKGEIDPSISDKEKEKLMNEFQKAKTMYEEALKRIQLAGLDSSITNIECDEYETNELPTFNSSQCDVTAKQSTYVGMQDMHYYFSQ
uniref:Uncharacterized protein n=1 Tax=Strongyloides stercoralis TaxID=6248 RepID=A0A0K0EQF9_STRER